MQRDAGEVTRWAWLGDERATAARRQQLRSMLGPLPALGGLPTGELLRREATAAAQVEYWRLNLNSEEAVPALLLLPVDQAPRGLVLYCHAHGSRFEMGKDELLAGRASLQSPPYGHVLPGLGWAVLAIDHWCFGERNTRAERALVKQLLWEGRTLWGYRVHDSLAALDWLHAQPRFAGLKTVAMGLSMGCTMAVWTAALDLRVDACIDLCCLAEFDALLATGGHDLHGEYFFVPGLKREFTAAEIAALIAPRLHVSLIGRDDPLTPPAGVSAIDGALRQAYGALGQPDAWAQHTFDVGHQETLQMRALVLQTLETLLRPRAASRS